jgi:hypothetical protein
MFSFFKNKKVEEPIDDRRQAIEQSREAKKPVKKPAVKKKK